MKQILMMVMICIASNLFAQTTTDSITIKKVGSDYRYYQNNEKLNMTQLLGILQHNEMAFKQIRSAQTNHTLGLLSGVAGGIMVGYPLGIALGGGEPNWTLAIVGGVMVIISIPLSSSFTKKAHQAIETYNAGLQSTSFWDTHELRLSIAENGFGFTFSF